MTTRREYTAKFKCEAVRLAEERGNRSAVARELGLHLSVLRRWAKELDGNAERAFPGKGNPQDEELAQLRREPWAGRAGERRLKKGAHVRSSSGGMFRRAGVLLGVLPGLTGPYRVQVAQERL